MSGEYLLWIDVETTGIDPLVCDLLEVAFALTEFDDELSLVDEPRSWVIRHRSDLTVEEVAPAVLAMHSANGLWEESRQAADEFRVWGRVSSWIAWLRLHPDAKLHPAGRSVHFDCEWLRAKMPPDILQRFQLSHRHFDLTSIKMIETLRGHTFDAPEETHRALDDVLADIALARELLL